MEEQREWERQDEQKAAENVSEGHVDKLAVYKKMLELLQPGETVLRVSFGALFTYYVNYMPG